jgi:hypothetical protein
MTGIQFADSLQMVNLLYLVWILDDLTRRDQDRANSAQRLGDSKFLSLQELERSGTQGSSLQS